MRAVLSVDALSEIIISKSVKVWVSKGFGASRMNFSALYAGIPMLTTGILTTFEWLSSIGSSKILPGYS
jgi:hypothetical protein